MLWPAARMVVTDGESRMFFDSDRVGFRAVDLTFTATCDTGGTTEVLLNDEPGTKRFEKVVLRDDGASKAKAAAISNAAANSSREEVGSRGGSSGSYEDWTVDELRERAAELDVEGRSDMTKDELIKALRE